MSKSKLTKITNVFAHLVAPDGAVPGDTFPMFTEEAQAVEAARELARRHNQPYYVYKMVTTHYIKAPVSVVEVVK